MFSLGFAYHNADPAISAINAPTNTTFKIQTQKSICTSICTVVTLSTEDDNKFLEQLKSGFKRKFKWNKYISEMSNQDKTINFNHLIDPTFNKVNRLFVLSFLFESIIHLKLK